MCRKDDRLSSLPNDVLIIILSCLPTKSAISTSVLSWSWRDLWTQLTVLRFKTSDLSTNMFNCGFFVTFRQMSWQKINSLEIIVATSTSKSYINTLVEDVLYVVPNVKELRVKIETGGDLIHVPRCIFKKPTLESLEMDGLMIIGHYHHLPKLRKLIINVRNCDLFYLENVLKSCPSLKILRVWVDTTEKLTDPIEIKSRNLKWVCLNLVGTFEACSEGKKQVMIDAPKLEYLEVNSPVLLKFCFLKTPSGVSRAKLSMGGYDSRMFQFERVPVPEHILKILNPIFQVKTLSLCGNDILFALHCIGENKVEMFRKLTCVEIKLGCDLDYSSISGARKFLKACPNLKKLVLSTKHGTLFWVKWLFSFMVENDSEFASLRTIERRRLKLIGDFDRVEKDGKIMVEITTHVYENDDQLINYAKGFALPNQMWVCRDSTYVNSLSRLWLLQSMKLCLGRKNNGC